MTHSPRYYAVRTTVRVALNLAILAWCAASIINW